MSGIDPMTAGAKDPASMQFSCLFNGFSYGATTLRSGRLYYKEITGTDTTGYRAVEDIQAFFGTGALLEMQLIHEDTSLAPNSQLTVTTTPSVLVSNSAIVNDLNLNVLTRTSASGASSYPQIWLAVTRSDYSTQGDIEEVYYSFVTMLPANLATIMDYAAGANFWTMLDIKTGGYTSQQIGDRRFVSGIIQDGSGLYWYTKMDNNANGVSVDPRVGTAVSNFWTNPLGYGVGIDLGVPLLLEYYLKRPAKINTVSAVTETGATLPRYEYNDTDGIALGGVTNLSTGVFTTLLDQHGGRHYGASNRDDDRIMTGCYCTGNDPYSMLLTRWQVYDKIPSHSMLRTLL